MSEASPPILESETVYGVVRIDRHGNKWLDAATIRFTPEGSRMAAKEIDKDLGKRYAEENRCLSLLKMNISLQKS